MARKKSLVQSPTASELTAVTDSTQPALTQVSTELTPSTELVAEADTGTSKALTAAERQKLAKCEALIAKHLESCFGLGRAIRDIRDSRLYREEFDSFEEYCQTRWELARSTVYNLIDAADVFDNLNETNEVLPVNEYQARQLAKLNADDQRRVWQQVVAQANHGDITGKMIRSVIADLIPVDAEVEIDDGTPCKAITQMPKKGFRSVIISDITTDNQAVTADKLRDVLAHSSPGWAEDCHLLVLTRCADDRAQLAVIEEFGFEAGVSLIVEQPHLRQPYDWSFGSSEIQIIHARRGNAQIQEKLSNLVKCDESIRDDGELPFSLAGLLVTSTAKPGDVVGVAGSLESLRLAAEQRGCSIFSIREEPQNRLAA